MRLAGRERVLSLGLLIVLLVTSSLLVANLDLLQRAIALPAPSVGRERFGELFVEAWLAEDINNVHVIRPLQRLGVSISRNNLPVTLLPLYTNANGILRLRLPVSEYLVNVEDQRFQLLVKLEIQADKVTHLLIHLRKVANVPSFYELYDSDGSGWVDPWEKVVMALPTRELNVAQGQTVFIETLQSTESLPPARRPYIISSTILSITSQQGVIWLQLRPNTQLRTTGIAFIELVLYEPAYTVRTYAK